MDDEDRKIGMLIAAFHDQRQQLQKTIDALGQTGAQLQREVRGSATAAVAAALEELHSPIREAGQALIDLQRLSLWRAAWEHVLVAAVAMAIALLAVWWYVPSLGEITARRANLAQLEAAIADREQRGAKIVLSSCGPKKRLCVAVDESAGAFADRKLGQSYRIAQGY